MVVDSRGVILKSPKEMGLMRIAGRHLAEILVILQERIAPGMTTAELDAIAEQEIKTRKLLPAFKGYPGSRPEYPYPACLCISINDEVVHGIPGPRVMNEGDVVSIDAGVIYRGWVSDSAVTVVLGEGAETDRRLRDTTERAMMAGISQARPGARLGDVASAIQRAIEPEGFGVVRKYVGHGVGRDMHEPPAVPNFGAPGTGLVLRAGMCIAIEPMVTVGSYLVKEMPDGWTVCTADGSRAAHFEHTIAITERGPEVLSAL